MDTGPPRRDDAESMEQGIRFSGDSPLPVRILSENSDILNAPGQIVCDNTPIPWTLRRKEAGDDSSVLLEWKGETAQFTLEARAEIYFEDVIRLDVTVPRGAAPESLALEFRVPRRIAAFVLRSPVIFGGFFTTCPVPGKGRIPSHPREHSPAERQYGILPV